MATKNAVFMRLLAFRKRLSDKKKERSTVSKTAKNAPGNKTYNSIEEIAEAYYGENATDPQAVGKVSVTRNDQKGTTVLAGDVLTLRVNYTLEAAPTFDYGNGALPIFDTYDHTKIKLKLPEGLSVTKTNADGTLTGVGTYEEDPNETNTWILTLASDSINASSSSTGSFTVNLLVEGNGELEIGKVFEFAETDLVSLTTQFTVIDKTQDLNTEVKTYTQTSTGGGVESVISGTNDKWGIGKEFVSATPSDDKQTVTVRFEIDAGLQADDGSIITDPNTYERNGRVPFDSITLTEDLDVQNREGKELTPTSITVIPQFDENPINFTGKENQKIEIPVDSCAGQVSGGKVADSAPFYSVYYVDVVYPYEDFIADYSDSNQDPLTVSNTAQLDYTLKGGSPEMATATASGEVGEVTQPAALTIRKYIPETVTGNFGFTSEGTTNGISRNPASGIPTEETTDSNFSRQSATAGAFERFYLWPTDITTTWDNTKDVGLVLNRDLKITKTAKDDPTESIAGAEFKVYGPFDAGKGAAADLTGLTLVASGTTGADGTLTFEDLLWFKEYVVVETTPAQGYEIDGAEGSGTNIEKIDGKDGTWLLKVPETTSMVKEDTMTVANVRETEVSLQASKTLTGRTLQADEFKFQLLSSDGTTVLQDHVGNDADGSVSFAPVKLQGEGTYTFYIREQIPTGGDQNGVTYDQTAYRAVVTTAWNDTDKKLEVTPVQYFKGTEQTPATGGATFTNRYEASGTWTPEGTKTLTGRDMKAGETYTFLVTENGSTVSTGTASGGKYGQAVDIAFSQISYTLDDVGEHSYTITERSDSATGSGVSYDDTSYTVRATVTDNKDGTLTATPEYPEGGVKFVNRYTPAPVTYAPAVTKTLNGHVLPVQTKSFTFTLEKNAFTPDDGAELPANTNLTLTVNGKQLPSKEQGTFEAITFTKAGTYTFTIKETAGSDAGYTYDSAEWTLTVTVEDQGGKLAVTSHSYTKKGTSDNAAAEFTNTYQVTPTEYTPQVKKTMKQGSHTRPSAQTFTFTLTAADTNPAGGAEIEENDTSASVEVPAGSDNTGWTPGNDPFGKITFKKAGTYSFTIRETEGSVPRWEYDSSVWTLTVTVSDVNGTLQVDSHTYTKAGTSGIVTDSARFENNYQPIPVMYAPSVQKELTGETERPEKVSFHFELKVIANPDSGAVIPTNGTTASVEVEPEEHNQKAYFGGIGFYKAGTYVFEISELNDGVKGYEYDTQPWTLTVTVVDRGGRLAVDDHTFKRTGDADRTDHAVFTNRYQVDPITYEPQVKKTVTGDVPQGRDETFTFRLERTDAAPADGSDLDAGDVKETKVQGNGTNTFEKITFTRSGTYKFKITEVNDKTPGYSYDGNIWILTVGITVQGGKLAVASTSYVQQAPGTLTGSTQAEFTNVYTTTETTYTPKVSKTITGDRTSKDAEFEFTLQADAGNPAGASVTDSDALQTSVTGEGEAVFAPITFRRAGTYRFTISEDQGTEAGYTYDAKPWTLTVTVEDIGSFLTVTDAVYSRAGQTASEEMAEFINTYEVIPTEYIPTVEKRITGDLPEGKEDVFRFQISEKDGNPTGAVLPGQTEAEVAGSGTASFEKILFEQAGTYQFEVVEINDGIAGYQYDGSVWTLTVTVVDTDSVLSVESAAYTKAGENQTAEMAVFENHYNPKEAAYTPRVIKKLTGDRPLETAAFSFVLQADASNPEGAVMTGTSASVAGAGMTSFAPITFTKAGTYEFEIREVDGKVDGYTYDEYIWKLMIEVKDADGILTVADVKYQKIGTFSSNNEAAEFTNEYKSAVAAGGNVKTGDQTNIPGALAGLSVSALFILVLMQRRRREEKRH